VADPAHLSVPVSRGSGLADLLAVEGVEEVCHLRSGIGLMAYHGGALEEMTDVIAEQAAARSGASLYAVIQPPGQRTHVPSTQIRAEESDSLTAFLDHVETVISIHGFGRRGHFTSILVGGQGRSLAEHLGHHLRTALPAYRVITNLDDIPQDLRGVHPRNPVNLTRRAGVQLELPPRVRGSSPLWWEWDPIDDGPGHDKADGDAQSSPDPNRAGDLVPHTERLILALAQAIEEWSD